jgi:hypothetical protein
MTPEQMGNLFQEFSQAEVSTTRKYAARTWARHQQAILSDDWWRQHR